MTTNGKRVIGFAKLGRSFNLNPAKFSTVGGDVDVWLSLLRLSDQYPNSEIVLLGRNTREDPDEFFPRRNVVNPWREWHESAPGISEANDAHLAIEHFMTNAKEYLDTVDAMVVWLGQHGTSNHPVPHSKKPWGDPSTYTQPLLSSVNYCAYLVAFLNEWQKRDPRREVAWLCPDPRNYIKARDLAWPPRVPVIAQYQWKREQRHERYSTDGLRPTDFDPPFKAHIDSGCRNQWVAKHEYRYSALELTAIPYPPDSFQRPLSFGGDRDIPFAMIVNENAAYGKLSRKFIIRDYVFPIIKAFPLRGKWSAKGTKFLYGNGYIGVDESTDVTPIEHSAMVDMLDRTVATLTTPASESGWATAKPWECFRHGVLCFFHPAYDDQGHILPTDMRLMMNQDKGGLYWELGRRLRCRSAMDFKQKLERVLKDPDFANETQRMQYEYLQVRFAQTMGGMLNVFQLIEHNCRLDQEEEQS